MTSQAWSNFIWRIRVFSVNFDEVCGIIFMLSKLSIDQAVSFNKCFIIYRMAAKSYVICCNTAKVVKLKVHVLQPLNV